MYEFEIQRDVRIPPFVPTTCPRYGRVHSTGPGSFLAASDSGLARGPARSPYPMPPLCHQHRAVHSQIAACTWLRRRPRAGVGRGRFWSICKKAFTRISWRLPSRSSISQCIPPPDAAFSGTPTPPPPISLSLFLSLSLSSLSAFSPRGVAGHFSTLQATQGQTISQSPTYAISGR